MNLTRTPLRQMARLYGAFLAMPNMLAELGRRLETLPTAADLGASSERIDAALARLSETISAHPPVTAAPDPRKPLAEPRSDVYERAGFRLMLDPTSLVDECVINTGMWELEQVTYLTSLIRLQRQKHDPVFLDIGAYWGLYSLVAMREGVRRVHAFEADRHNHAQLQTQLFLNNAVGRITAHHLAVSSQAGRVLCLDSRTHPDGNRGGIGLWGGRDAGHPAFEIQAVTIDQHLPMNGEIIFVKLDVEGHEPMVLQGMRETIQHNRLVMQIEIFPEAEASTMPVAEQLGLRLFHKIGPDHFYTNLSDAELGGSA